MAAVSACGLKLEAAFGWSFLAASLRWPSFSRSATLRAGLRRKEGDFSLLTRHLFLIPARRDLGNVTGLLPAVPPEAGLEHDVLKLVYGLLEKSRFHRFSVIIYLTK